MTNGKEGWGPPNGDKGVPKPGPSWAPHERNVPKEMPVPPVAPEEQTQPEIDKSKKKKKSKKPKSLE